MQGTLLKRVRDVMDDNDETPTLGHHHHGGALLSNDAPEDALEETINEVKLVSLHEQNEAHKTFLSFG